MSFLSSLSNLLRPTPPPEADVVSALKRIAGIIEKSLPTEPGFERTLAPRVRNALDYCNRLVAQLPQPLGIERTAFASEPYVHALFASADDIDAMIGHSPALHDHVLAGEGAGSEECFALLAARREEKSVLGVEREGDLVRIDVPQRLLHFSNHNLSLIADSEDQAHARLKEAALDGLIKTFAAHVRRLRGEQDTLRQERALASTRNLLSKHHGNAADEARYSRTIVSLNERLGRNADALLPKRQIEALADFLASPEEALRVETVTLHVDRGGRIIESKAAQPEGATRLQLTELISRDRRRHVIVPVRFNRRMALQALDRTRRERARFMVI